MKEKIIILAKWLGVVLLLVCTAVVLVDFWRQKSEGQSIGQLKDALMGKKVVPRIEVFTPEEWSTVHSPIHVKGQASRSWFFGNVFPVTLVDQYGVLIASGEAIADADSADKEMRQFEVTLDFDSKVAGRGVISFTRNDDMGDEFADTFELNVRLD